MQKWIVASAVIASAFIGASAFAQDNAASANTQGGVTLDDRTTDHSAIDTANRALDQQEKLQARLESLENELERLREQTQQIQTSTQQSTLNAAADYITDRFTFGSYGRVQPSMNPDGMTTGRQPRIVYPAPRVDEGSYVELYLKYTPYKSDTDNTTVDVVTTLAIDGDKLFHYDGNWDSSIAVRNLYVEAQNLWLDGLVLWAGSRMYRGDDIYLLDTWPLDNLNTYGGGGGFHYAPSRTNVDIHFGTNRLKDNYQYQVVDVINERFVGTQDVVFLDRQRFIASLKAEQLLGGGDLPLFKIKLYAEVHAIGEGEYLETQPEHIKKLPSDSGWLIGAQFGISGFLDQSYVNLFLKYAEGLAAYGEKTIPFGVDTDMKAKNAKNFTAGLSAGIDILDYADILFGGYVRYFQDADGFDDYDDGVEGVWDVRLTGHVGKYFRPAIELSQQLRHANAVNPVSLSQDLASIFKFSLLPAVRFADGPLGRPEIRFNYTLSVLNDAAKLNFAEKDPLRNTTYVHYIGLAAEWWFNL